MLSLNGLVEVTVEGDISHLIKSPRHRELRGSRPKSHTWKTKMLFRNKALKKAKTS